jgi:hypothetical protein
MDSVLGFHYPTGNEIRITDRPGWRSSSSIVSIFTVRVAHQAGAVTQVDGATHAVIHSRLPR